MSESSLDIARRIVTKAHIHAQRVREGTGDVWSCLIEEIAATIDGAVIDKQRTIELQATELKRMDECVKALGDALMTLIKSLGGSEAEILAAISSAQKTLEEVTPDVPNKS